MKIIMAMASLLLTTISPAPGNPNDPNSTNDASSSLSAGLENDSNTKYIWRGITYNEGLIIQPLGWLSVRNFTLIVCGSITLHDIHHSIKRNEIDACLSYQYSLLNFEFLNSFSYNYYPRQPDSPPTGEFFLGIDYPIGDFKLTSGVTLDMLEYPGACFLEQGVECNKSITDHLDLAFALSLGSAMKKFNETYVGISKSTMSFLCWDCSVTYRPLVGLYIRPHLQLNRIIDKDLAAYLHRYAGYWGISVEKEF
jgi:hypothetical protein